MGGEILKKFGRYFLLDQMAQGGMAEIYRARLASLDGAGRLLVIKRIQAGYGDNNEFLHMFKSEIKVTMGLSHPNIVQLHDFGEEAGQPFIAMEYVDGKNLRQLISRVSERDEWVPIELAVHIIEQVARGLHYAHHFKDKLTGQPLNIVHRDISPQNIIISFEGDVKIIDFGIAKASTNVEATRVNVIKGKPSYLSPEQIAGEVLDGRSDLFSLGTVLWEVLTGRKLFSAENDRAVLMQIESCTSHVKPPSTINSAVPKELDYIVLKALAKNPAKRFQTAEEFQRALHKFLCAYLPEFSSSDLGYFAKDLFMNDIVEDRKRIQRLNEEVERLLNGKGLNLSSVSMQGGQSVELVQGDTTTVATYAPQDSAIDAKTALESGRVIELNAPPRSNQQNGSDLSQNPKAHPRRVKSSRADQQAALGPSQPRKKARGMGPQFLVASLLVVGVVFALRNEVSVPDVIRFLESAKKWSPISTFKLDKIPANNQPHISPSLGPAPKTIALRLNITPPGGNPTISVNGLALSKDSPVLDVPLDSPLDLVVEREGYRRLSRFTYVDSKQAKGLREYVMEVQLEPNQFGFLSIRTTPSADAVIQIDGRKWVKRTPFEQERLPVGTYSIKLINDVLGMEKNIATTVQEGKVTSVDERLEIKD